MLRPTFSTRFKASELMRVLTLSLILPGVSFTTKASPGIYGLLKPSLAKLYPVHQLLMYIRPDVRLVEPQSPLPSKNFQQVSRGLFRPGSGTRPRDRPSASWRGTSRRKSGVEIDNLAFRQRSTKASWRNAGSQRCLRMDSECET